MSYDALLEKVRQAEQALEARERSVSADWRQTRRTWRALWTPGRIAAGGAIAGFAVGWSRGGRASVAGTGFGLLKLATSLVTLAGSLQAKAAADDAGDAANKTQQAAHEATEAAGCDPPAPATDTPHPMHGDRRRPDPSWSSPPTAAAAATDVSERTGRR